VIATIKHAADSSCSQLHSRQFISLIITPFEFRASHIGSMGSAAAIQTSHYDTRTSRA